MKNLIVTVGLPRSGKSTWAKQTGYPMVNPDSLRLAVHGQPFIKAAEPMIWTLAKYMVDSLFLAGHDYVVLDATNTTYERRCVWEEYCKDRGHLIWYKCFDVHRDVCVGRAHKAGLDDLIPVIERMAPYITFPENRLWMEQQCLLLE